MSKGTSLFGQVVTHILNVHTKLPSCTSVFVSAYPTVHYNTSTLLYSQSISVLSVRKVLHCMFRSLLTVYMLINWSCQKFQFHCKNIGKYVMTLLHYLYFSVHLRASCTEKYSHISLSCPPQYISWRTTSIINISSMTSTSQSRPWSYNSIYIVQFVSYYTESKSLSVWA